MVSGDRRLKARARSYARRYGITYTRALWWVRRNAADPQKYRPELHIPPECPKGYLVRVLDERGDKVAVSIVTRSAFTPVSELAHVEVRLEWILAVAKRFGATSGAEERDGVR